MYSLQSLLSFPFYLFLTESFIPTFLFSPYSLTEPFIPHLPSISFRTFHSFFSFYFIQNLSSLPYLSIYSFQNLSSVSFLSIHLFQNLQFIIFLLFHSEPFIPSFFSSRTFHILFYFTRISFFFIFHFFIHSKTN